MSGEEGQRSRLHMLAGVCMKVHNGSGGVYGYARVRAGGDGVYKRPCVRAGSGACMSVLIYGWVEVESEFARVRAGSGGVYGCARVKGE